MYCCHSCVCVCVLGTHWHNGETQPPLTEHRQNYCRPIQLTNIKKTIFASIDLNIEWTIGIFTEYVRFKSVTLRNSEWKCELKCKFWFFFLYDTVLNQSTSEEEHIKTLFDKHTNQKILFRMFTCSMTQLGLKTTSTLTKAFFDPCLMFVL